MGRQWASSNCSNPWCNRLKSAKHTRYCCETCSSTPGRHSDACIQRNTPERISSDELRRQLGSIPKKRHRR